jgi:class 3 adenylate cyclase/HAMP domain-containing protein
MWKNASLAVKLIIAIISATALIFAAVLAYNYQTSKALVLREMKENARNLTWKTVYQIDSILNSIEKVPESLAAFLECNCFKPTPLEPLLKEMVRSNKDIFGMAAAFEPKSFEKKQFYFAPYVHRGRDGLELKYLGSREYHYYYWDWYSIPKARNRPGWSEPYFDEGGGNVMMSTYSVPVYRLSKDGKRLFWGVVTADISLAWLENIIAQVKILQSGYAFLISPQGTFITFPRQHFDMRGNIFGLAATKKDDNLKEIGRQMAQGGEGFARSTDFITGRKSILYYAPLPSNCWSLGIIFPEDELFANLRQLSLQLSLIGLIGLGGVIFLITVISRTITRPLRSLEKTTQAIGQGDFAVTIPETGPREIRHLSQAFNRLGGQLSDYIAKRDFIRDTFGRYVTQEVVNKLMESRDGLELGGENRELSILMSDLRGFTALTSEMDPQRVIIFLNRYLGKMIEILMDHRGVIDEIVGDGILAFFGAPEPMADHPVQAVACALQMQAAMAEINTANERDGLPHLEMGVAVNTGDVVVGNIGSERRTKYGIVGAQVNFTGRMEAYTVGGQVLISPSTYNRVQDLLEIRDTLRVSMKGVPEPVTLYDIRGLHGPFQVILPEMTTSSLTPLTQPLPIHLYCIKNKIVTGAPDPSRICQLSLTEALVEFNGELKEWDDVRLHLLDQTGQEIPGKIFAKVLSLTRQPDQSGRAQVRFTSVSPETYTFLRQSIGIK